MKTASLVVFGCTAGAAILASVLFSRGTNVVLKRRIFPWYLFGIGAAFIFGIWTNEHSVSSVCFAALGLLVFNAMYLGLRLNKFCDRCGKQVQGRRLKEPLICPNCGSDLP